MPPFERPPNALLSNSGSIPKAEREPRLEAAQDWIKVVERRLYALDSDLQQAIQRIEGRVMTAEDGVAIREAARDLQFALRDVYSRRVGISDDQWGCATRALGAEQGE